jgi:anti-anti-sigma factor
MSASGQSAREPAGVKVVSLPAEVDYASAQRVRQDLSAAFAPGVTLVVADFSSSTFCDTAGIREMVVAHKLAAARGVHFRLVVPSRLTRIFALTGLAPVLAIYPTLPAALATAQGPGTGEPSAG